MDEEDGIYSSVPEEKIKPGYEDKRYEILAFLKAHKGLWFTANAIATKCGFPTRGTQVEVRKAITMLMDEMCPIISTGRGFAYAKQVNQIRVYAENLEIRKAGLQRRIECVWRTFEKYKGSKSGEVEDYEVPSLRS